MQGFHRSESGSSPRRAPPCRPPETGLLRPRLRHGRLAAARWMAAAAAAVALAAGVQAQTPDKAEMQRALKEAQQLMQGLDPQTRQQLQDALRMAGAAQPGADEGRLPERRTAELAGISRQPLSPGALKAFVDKLPGRIAPALAAERRQRAEKIEAQALAAGGQSLSPLRSAANGLAALGAWPEALWLSSRLAQLSGQAQDLSNLAAMLVLHQLEPAALPLLHTLDARYPNNSTLLNNMGQAYFQLGAQEEAERYLLAAVRRSPMHPQANAARARLQLARGDKAGAQASLHAALQGGYSPSKEQLLRQAGGKLVREDVAWKLPLPADPLGLQSARPSVYPESVEALPMVIELERTSRIAAEAEAARLSQRAAALPQTSAEQAAAVLRMPFLHRSTQLMQIDAQRYGPQLEKLGRQKAELMLKLATKRREMDQQIAAIDERGRKQYANVAGGYQFDYSCGEVKKAMQDFLNQTVPGLKAHETELGELMRRQSNEQVYGSQFVMPAAEFQRAQLSAKASFTRGAVGATEALGAVAGLVQQRRNACWRGAAPAPKAHKLPEFNDLHCQELAELNIPGVGRMSFRCDRTDVKLEPTLAPFEAAWSSRYTGRGDEMQLLRASAAISVDAFKFGAHSEFDERGWQRGGVSATVGAELGGVKGGPLEIGVSAEVAGSLEFDRNGLSDVVVKAGLEAQASSVTAKTDEGGRLKSGIKAGAESSISYNAGYNGEISQGFSPSAFKL